jgi:hypothetical protein
MKNGRMLSGKRSKHLDIRYFYLKDHIDLTIPKKMLQKNERHHVKH